ncbi:MAG: NYN domain-containing protein [Planctomycetales bacterium]
MSAPFLIIDGYNLMHAVGMARADYGPGGLEKQRNRFLAWLVRNVPRSQQARTTVVFDAHEAPPGLPRHGSVEQIAVRFAAPGEDADSLIEELIAGHSAPRQVLLVSSDHRLQRAARRRRARFSDSDAFIERLARQAASREKQRQRAAENPPAKEGGTLGAEEVAGWLAEFGPVPEAENLSPALDPNEVEFWIARLRELDDE